MAAEHTMSAIDIFVVVIIRKNRQMHCGAIYAFVHFLSHVDIDIVKV